MNPLQAAAVAGRMVRSGPTIARVKRRGLSYLTPRKLLDLAWCVSATEVGRTPGAIIEAGVALGGSAIVLAKAKNPSRPLILYDVFGTIPEPGELDGDDVHERFAEIAQGTARGLRGGLYYGYHDDLMLEVEANLGAFGIDLQASNVRLVQGRFEDTFREADEPVAICHLDGDWYSSVRTVLESVTPRLVPGGRVIVDDYDAWSGCRRAVDEHLRECGERLRLERHGAVHLVKVHA